MELAWVLECAECGLRIGNTMIECPACTATLNIVSPSDKSGEREPTVKKYQPLAYCTCENTAGDDKECAMHPPAAPVQEECEHEFKYDPKFRWYWCKLCKSPQEHPDTYTKAEERAFRKELLEVLEEIPCSGLEGARFKVRLKALSRREAAGTSPTAKHLAWNTIMR
jgi:hypothetical protein